MCVPCKTLCLTLKGCKWAYLVFLRKRMEPRMLPWQQHRFHSVSLAMYISGAGFEENCTNVSGDILDSAFYSLKEQYHRLRMHRWSAISGPTLSSLWSEKQITSTSGGSNPHSHGGCRNSSGCKKVFNPSSSRKREWEKLRRRIRLEENIYKSWLQAKLEAGYSSSSTASSDSEFAAHLLSLEYCRR